MPTILNAGTGEASQARHQLDALTRVVRFANRGLGYERFPIEAKLAYIQQNIPAACPPRSVVLVNQGRGFANLFYLSSPGSLSVKDATAQTARLVDELAFGLALAFDSLAAHSRRHFPRRATAINPASPIPKMAKVPGSGTGAARYESYNEATWLALNAEL